MIAREDLAAAVMSDFISACKRVADVVIDDMSLENAQAMQHALDEDGASLTLPATLAGPPMVIGYLTYQDGRAAVEAFRFLANASDKKPVWKTLQ